MIHIRNWRYLDTLVTASQLDERWIRSLDLDMSNRFAYSHLAIKFLGKWSVIEPG
ncbi:hypothetical protein J31TS3_36640 [Paenibacillus lactis]|nr:hypothetical protein J31TS3_36640 [Paenibacillus lactis]